MQKHEVPQPAAPFDKSYLGTPNVLTARFGAMSYDPLIARLATDEVSACQPESGCHTDINELALNIPRVLSSGPCCGPLSVLLLDQQDLLA